MPAPFRIALTADFLNARGEPAWGDIGLEVLDDLPGIAWDYLREDEEELSASGLEGIHGVLVNGPRVGAAALSNEEPPLVVARFGAGYDSVDLAACTEAGVLVVNTPDGVRRPVALSVLTLLLALAHRLPQKQRLAAEGAWSRRVELLGERVTGSTIGIVGLGNIGREVVALTAPLGVDYLAYDPYAGSIGGTVGGVPLVGLEELLLRSDFVVITVALTEETRGLIGADELKRMKTSAFLINVARGPVVDESALTAALARGGLAGAGLDVFEVEPLPMSSPLHELDNVILTPHSLCWGSELARGNGVSALTALRDVAEGYVPRHVVNPGSLEHPRLAGLRRR